MLAAKVKQLREVSGLQYDLVEDLKGEDRGRLGPKFGIRLRRKLVVRHLSAAVLFTFLDGWVFGLTQFKQEEAKHGSKRQVD